MYLQNYPLPLAKQDLKIQWEINFLTFFNTDRNAPIFLRIEIWTFSFQICFRKQFSTSGSGRTENTQVCVLANFQFDHFLKSKIYFESRFTIKMSIFLLEFFFGAFRLVFKKVRQLISHCIFKSCSANGRGKF